jgi:hypothetical protein
MSNLKFLVKGTIWNLLTSKKFAQNGHAEAARIAGFFIRSAARLCALCASATSTCMKIQ